MTTQAAPPAGRVTGQPVRRKEDARVITGQARWTGNLTLPGLAHLAFGLIFGLFLGYRRRIVIMTAAPPPGGYPPARTVL